MNRASSAELICYVCTAELAVGEKYLQCMATSCGKLYHQSCVKKTNLTRDEMDTWVCPDCYNERNIGARSSDFPVSAPVTAINVVTRNKNGTATPVSSSDDSISVTLEFQQMRYQMSTLSEQLSAAMSTIAQYQIALSEWAIKFEAVNLRLGELEKASGPCKCSQTAVPPSNTAKSDRKPNPRRKRKSNNRRVLPPGPTEGTSEPGSSLDRVLAEPLEDVLRLSPPCDQGSVQEDRTLIRNEELEDASAGKWQTVGKPAKRFSSVRCTAGPGVTPLRAVEYRKYIHLWNMLSGVDEIRAYLKSLNPGVTCIVEELKPKGEYKSYKIGVPPALFDQLLSDSVWPDNARIRPWLFRKPRSNGSQQSRP